jgi:putative oxidoreductase
MFKKLLATTDDVLPLILRITLGVVMFPHGAQKVFGWFGGFGFTGTMGFFTQQLGIPTALAFLAIAAEFAGSLGLLAGFLTRVAAFGIACDMATAVVMAHLPNGFFMNWSGKQSGEGFEFHLLVIGICIALMWSGGGRRSIDRKIAGG